MNNMFDHLGEALVIIAVAIAAIMTAFGFFLGWLVFG